MRVQLLDVSILVAMHNPAHPHNEAALRGFDAEGQNRWATCPLTENGFVRVHAQTLFLNQRNGVYEGCFILETMKQMYGATHRFWNDSASLNVLGFFCHRRSSGISKSPMFIYWGCVKNGEPRS